MFFLLYSFKNLPIFFFLHQTESVKDILYSFQYIYLHFQSDIYTFSLAHCNKYTKSLFTHPSIAAKLEKITAFETIEG